MIDDKPSHTAIHVAATRAAHLRFDAPPHLIEDDVAAELLGDEFAGLIDTLDDSAHWVLRENRLFVPMRARFVEDQLARAYDAGVRHFVILGAGLDSFAFRRPPTMGDLEIVEVDHPATQRFKRARLDAIGRKLPHGVCLVECDFERARVSDALALAGLEAGTPAFVSWMGVIYYLERATARAALRELATRLGPGSTIALDFLRPYEDLSPRYAELTRLSGQYLRKTGEPHVNFLRDGELEADILEAGFGKAEVVARRSLVERYVRHLETDVPLSERFGLALARR